MVLWGVCVNGIRYMESGMVFTKGLSLFSAILFMVCTVAKVNSGIRTHISVSNIIEKT